MTHALTFAPNHRRNAWLGWRKSRASRSMVQVGRAQAKMVNPKVYCDPRMPQGWTELED